MKVVLIKDFEGYGTMGTVIEVKDGFARNYLIPRGIALPATESNLRHVQSIGNYRRKKKKPLHWQRSWKVLFWRSSIR
jgi:large subunit ribosomal protein L9